MTIRLVTLPRRVPSIVPESLDTVESTRWLAVISKSVIIYNHTLAQPPPPPALIGRGGGRGAGNEDHWFQ